MDWSRAKSILILTFIFLNLYLGSQVFQTLQEKVPDIPSEKRISEALRSQKIKYYYGQSSPESVVTFNGSITELPEKEGWKKEISNGNIVYTKKLKKSIPFQEKNLYKWISEEVPFGQDFEMSTMQRSKDSVSVYQKYEGKIVFDGMLKLGIQDNQIISIAVTHFDIQAGPEQEIISYKKAMYALLVQKGIYDTKLSQINLGYLTLTNPNGRYTGIPYWYFLDEKNRKIYYVSAKSNKQNLDVEVVQYEP
ncbi:two-component system regulatory protein YycI [Hazenella sp. IB182357]|uniref:Two-component system regulatory protein YycI n=1 Tax=Polycladospora coralii TaxID=2771432 RepID=A0A926N8Z0_9BACL|nr:two-component system regulatory protein YycI [Polycladospora coralii]MBD1372007.1 two-component system regulatory protein YycI [Polycladospora coralii]MBS7530513.1 two-component system regulatory protein YycI [Polycladospora coralii]